MTEEQIKKAIKTAYQEGIIQGIRMLGETLARTTSDLEKAFADKDTHTSVQASTNNMEKRE